MSTSPVAVFPAVRGSSVAGGLALLFLGAAAPVGVMTFRAIPLLVGLGLACLIAAGDWRGAAARLRRSPDRLLLAGLAALLAMGVASLAYAEALRPAAVDLGVVGLFVGLGAWAWGSEPHVDRGRLSLALAGGFVLATVLILIEMRFDMPLHRALKARSDLAKMNHAAVLLTLWLWPVLRLTADQWGRRAAWVLLAVAGLGIMGSHSTTAHVAFPLAMLAFVACRAGWRGVPVAAGIVLAVLALAMPWLMAAIQHWIPPALLEAMGSRGHAAERIAIWTAFSHAVALWPWLGVGFDGSGLIGFGPRLALFPETMWVGIKDSHPHNMLLQVWVELGLPGALACAACWLGWGRAAGRQGWPRLRPFGAAVLGAAPIVVLVGYGAWQAWWIAVLAGLPVLLQLAGTSSEREGTA